MPSARYLVVDPAVGGTFHCISRCVRRAFLCGRDAFSGRNFEHRRGWVKARVEEITELFAVNVFAYTVMTNHLHLVLATAPERARAWSDAEVARRWLCLFPGPGGKRGQPPNEAAILALCQDVDRLAICRGRLGDVSWFMRCLSEPIARRANREDDCTGRFWEGRFKCKRLVDDGALLAAMVYVDLNAVRAKVATTPESSDFSSAQDRSLAWCARRQLAAAPAQVTPAQEALIAQARADAERDRWLVPFGKDGSLCSKADTPTPDCGRPHQSATDPSSTWLSDMSVESYLELLDWTGRECRAGKRGQIPGNLRPILERLDLNVEAWVDNIACYGSLFRRIVGKIDRMREWADTAGRAWLHGYRGARLLYTNSA